MHEPEWLADNLMRIDGVEFYLTAALDELHSHESQRNHFLLGKNRQMIDDVLALRQRERIDRILDVGIFKGDSAALYAKLLNPSRHVAIEYAAKPAAALAAFIDDNALGYRLIPFYGTNQSDAKAMGKAIPLAKPALSNLLIEITMLCASRPDIVTSLSIITHSAVLRRGPASIEPGTFDIGEHYLCRDRWFKPAL